MTEYRMPIKPPGVVNWGDLDVTADPEPMTYWAIHPPGSEVARYHTGISKRAILMLFLRGKYTCFLDLKEINRIRDAMIAFEAER